MQTDKMIHLTHHQQLYTSSKIGVTTGYRKHLPQGASPTTPTSIEYTSGI